MKTNQKQNHYYSEKQDSEYSPFLINIKSRNQEYQLYTASGIFSIKHLDKGTEVMLKYCQINQAKTVCDLGCGYGVVGLTLLKEDPSLKVVFLDSSERAIQLTKKNLSHLKLKGVAKTSNIFSKVPDFQFDIILTNPPYSAGREVCINFIKESLNHLTKNGSLQLVCRRRKGGDFLEEQMNSIFGNVEVIGQKSGFRLYKSVKIN